MREDADELALAAIGLGEALGGVALLGDVGVGAEPAQHIAPLVLDGERAREEPAVLAVVAAQGKRVLPGDPGGNSGRPFAHHRADVVGVVDVPPAPSAHLFGDGAGELVPAPVVPEDVAVRLGHPGELRDVVRHVAEPLLALLALRLQAAPFGDVADDADQHARPRDVGALGADLDGKRAPVLAPVGGLEADPANVRVGHLDAQFLVRRLGAQVTDREPHELVAAVAVREGGGRVRLEHLAVGAADEDDHVAAVLGKQLVALQGLAGATMLGDVAEDDVAVDLAAHRRDQRRRHFGQVRRTVCPPVQHFAVRDPGPVALGDETPQALVFDDERRATEPANLVFAPAEHATGGRIRADDRAVRTRDQHPVAAALEERAKEPLEVLRAEMEPFSGVRHRMICTASSRSRKVAPSCRGG